VYPKNAPCLITHSTATNRLKVSFKRYLCGTPSVHREENEDQNVPDRMEIMTEGQALLMLVQPSPEEPANGGRQKKHPIPCGNVDERINGSGEEEATGPVRDTGSKSSGHIRASRSPPRAPSQKKRRRRWPVDRVELYLHRCWQTFPRGNGEHPEREWPACPEDPVEQSAEKKPPREWRLFDGNRQVRSFSAQLQPENPQGPTPTAELEPVVSPNGTQRMRNQSPKATETVQRRIAGQDSSDGFSEGTWKGRERNPKTVSSGLFGHRRTWDSLPDHPAQFDRNGKRQQRQEAPVHSGGP